MKLLIEFERIQWRDRHLPADLASINASADACRRNFPDSEFRQQTKAQSELILRRIEARRLHDA